MSLFTRKINRPVLRKSVMKSLMMMDFCSALIEEWRSNLDIAMEEALRMKFIITQAIEPP